LLSLRLASALHGDRLRRGASHKAWLHSSPQYPGNAEASRAKGGANTTITIPARAGMGKRGQACV
jgi:hypothetical protein